MNSSGDVSGLASQRSLPVPFIPLFHAAFSIWFSFFATEATHSSVKTVPVPPLVGGGKLLKQRHQSSNL